MLTPNTSHRTILKRDCTQVPFNSDKITQAIIRAFEASKFVTSESYTELSKRVSEEVIQRLLSKSQITVEFCQDTVEKVLCEMNYYEVFRKYVLYREKHNENRRKNIKSQKISSELKELFEKGRSYFSSDFAYAVYLRTYARWINEYGRREHWFETVQRYVDFMRENLQDKLSHEEYEEIYDAILKMEVMPSMRLLQFAGNAARRNNLCAYNCSYVAPEKLEDFRSIFMLLLSGCGVGFSIEKKYIDRLPIIMAPTNDPVVKFSIGDSREAWCDALNFGLESWYSGHDVVFDYTQIRPVGAKLYTTGGTSSGPKPLETLLNFTRNMILENVNRKLSTLQVYDLICMIGNIVKVGGVRRAALISLSNLDDIEMRDAKVGNFFIDNVWRCNSNNSAVYDCQPTDAELLKEFTALVNSGTGERGFFSRSNFDQQVPLRRQELLGNKISEFGCNPCCEILLQSHQLCNLSSIVCRPDDTEESLRRKMRLATLIGTYQATLTNFPNIDPEFQRRVELERLLGVSMTGIQECPIIKNAKLLTELKDLAQYTNQIYSRRFGINASTSITCIKPEGTLSCVVGTFGSGIHYVHDQYFIRRVRLSKDDPLAQLLKFQGVPCNPEIGSTWQDCTTWVFDFPLEADEKAEFKKNKTALEMLEDWKLFKTAYAEHNVSITVSVGKNEWISVLKWLKDNWSYVNGISFLPRDDHVYQLAPFESVTFEKYQELKNNFPKLDFSKLVYYEQDDQTNLKEQAACAGGNCDLY